MRDTILVVDDQPKKVSSTAGHALMNDHVYAEARFRQANQRVDELTKILQTGDLKAFVKITESEALTLHAMMMTSDDYYLLMRPNTIQVIEKIFEFREQNDIPVCFTLDAGPNIHMLYPARYEQTLKKFIDKELSIYAKSIIFDRAGKGPVKLNSN
jgi:diphosphomevalonate decarboxylase